MKKPILLIFFFFGFLSIHGQYTIAFVHLGPHIPTYLIDAARQARLFNPNAIILLIAEQKAIKNCDLQPFYQNKIEFIFVRELKSTSHHKEFIAKTSLDEGFREGFWRKCTERFFFLHELMEQKQICHVFHLEYDNMLYTNLQELLPVFYKYKIGATFDSDNRCIPGFMYIANAQALEKLITFIAKNASNGLTDMHVIALFKKLFPDYIDNLPIIIPEFVEECSLINSFGETTKNPSDYYRNIHQFNSIFDAAAIGQFLGGIDPLNAPIGPGFINETCLFDPSKLAFKWVLDLQGRKVPYACFNDKQYRINNLHIHSKNLKAFAS